MLTRFLLLLHPEGDGGSGQGSGDAGSQGDGQGTDTGQSQGDGDRSGSQGDQGQADSKRDDDSSQGGDEKDRKISALEKDNKGYRDRLKSLTEKVEGFEREKLSDQERLQADQKKLTDENAKLRQDLMEARLQIAVQAQSSSLSIIDPELAMHAIWEEVDFDDEGKPKNVEALLRDLVRKKPHLVGNGGGGGDGKSGAGRGNAARDRTADDADIEKLPPKDRPMARLTRAFSSKK